MGDSNLIYWCPQRYTQAEEKKEKDMIEYIQSDVRPKKRDGKLLSASIIIHSSILHLGRERGSSPHIGIY